MLSLMASCSVSRKATSATTETRATTNFTNVTNERDSVVIAERDTLKEVTVITIDRNEAGDTVRVSSVTDRERIRSRADVRSKKEEVRVERDTVYVERRDSNPRPSTLILTLKWIFTIVCAIIVLIIVIKLGMRRSLF